MTEPDRTLIDAVRAALRDAADPHCAPQMQAYMKSALPFYGVPKPVRSACLRPVLRAHAPTDRARWEATVRALYDEATYREERYAALDLLGIRAGRAWHDPRLVPVLEHLVVAGAWWDLVDEVAGHHLAPTHRAYPEDLAPVIRAWAIDDDVWIRRAAVLSQLGSRATTDRALLADVVDANAVRPEFWLRKAIGWALRDFSGTDPDWVRRFVDARPQLSGLSRREALRRIERALGATSATQPHPRDAGREARVASDITGE
jgi:3-methyladenine DNA glycosylase AlkD